jgi:2-polyprenyl-3-methyl-5-hydroxy-6-metoxy-1,4-benzoquinol methylase
MMIQERDLTINRNVSKFEEDILQTGSYAYTVERLSARLVNDRFSECIAKSFDFAGRTVLDIGCGDGSYTLEFPTLGVKEVVGMDPAAVAIEAANAKARKLGLDSTVKFEVGNIYTLAPYLADNRFDCIVLRGVLHHLPDPPRAIDGLATFGGTMIVLEPNGNNPVLKMIEKYSRYHIEHEERSFTPPLIRSWLTIAGFRVHSCKVFNLVPMFCPDKIARFLNAIGPIVERLPLVRDFACGQSIIVARK